MLRRPPPILALALCLAGMSLAMMPARSDTLPLQATDHILVRFNPAADQDLRHLPPAQALARLEGALSLPVGARLEETELARWLRQHRPPPPGAPTPSLLELNRFLYLRLPPGQTVEETIARLRHHPLLEYAEADGMGMGGATLPNDPNFGLQWHHRNLSHPGADIRTPEVWSFTTGSTNVILAILDTGLRTNLTEFSDRIVAGYDFVNDDEDPSDDHGHGTAVTGTAAATGNNGTVVAGVDWRCRIMPIKVLNSSNLGSYSDWAQGIDWAVLNGAKVINLSAGGGSGSAALTTAITNAIAAGVIFITITHNDGTSVIRFPGRLPEAITVGATLETDTRAGFSNYGPEIDLVAPGNNIRTVSTGGGLTTWWGTSFASPQVAAVCTLMAGLRPDLNQQLAAQFLTEGAEDEIGDATDTPGFDIYYGHGRLNALNTLLLAIPALAQVPNLQARRDPDAPGQIQLEFMAASNLTYSVLRADDLGGETWEPFVTVEAHPTNRLVVVEDPEADAIATRYYRLLLPTQP